MSIDVANHTKPVQSVKVEKVSGTGIANVLFFKLIQMSSPVFATSVTYLIPIVAFFWGLLDHEMLTPIQFFGAFIILIASRHFVNALRAKNRAARRFAGYSEKPFFSART